MKTNEIREKVKRFKCNINSFTKSKLVGYGTYSEVFLAISEKDNKEVALKIFNDRVFDEKTENMFYKEILILSSCKSKFVIKLLGFTDVYPFSMALEFAKYGSLYDTLRHKPGKPNLSGTQKTIIAMGVASGMKEIHKNGIIHCDLKSMNILLDEQLLPKICDFGISRFNEDIKDDENDDRIIGTAHWMAPEIFNSSEYSHKSDVYSFGILLWEMLTEKMPFDGESDMQVMTTVCLQKKRPIIPKAVSNELKELIVLCWAQSPQERPSFDHIFQLFLSKKVFFPNTNVNMLDEIIKYVFK